MTLANTAPQVLSASDDCSVMAILTEYLQGVANTDATTTLKVVKVSGYLLTRQLG
jgi:hypothetical protein